MTYRKFIEKYDLLANFTQVNSNPNFTDSWDSWDAAHWRVTIVKGVRQFITHYSKGRGHYEKEIKQYCKLHNIYPKGLRISELTDKAEAGKHSDRYLSKQLVLPHPDFEEVLSSIASDCTTVSNGQDIYEFSRESGYDMNDPNTQKTYDAVKESETGLKRLLGGDGFSELMSVYANDGYDQEAE